MWTASETTHAFTALYLQASNRFTVQQIAVWLTDANGEAMISEDKSHVEGLSMSIPDILPKTSVSAPSLTGLGE